MCSEHFIENDFITESRISKNDVAVSISKANSSTDIKRRMLFFRHFIWTNGELKVNVLKARLQSSVRNNHGKRDV